MTEAAAIIVGLMLGCAVPAAMILRESARWYRRAWRELQTKAVPPAA